MQGANRPISWGSMSSSRTLLHGLWRSRRSNQYVLSSSSLPVTQYFLQQDNMTAFNIITPLELWASSARQFQAEGKCLLRREHLFKPRSIVRHTFAQSSQFPHKQLSSSWVSRRKGFQSWFNAPHPPLLCVFPRVAFSFNSVDVVAFKAVKLPWPWQPDWEEGGDERSAESQRCASYVMCPNGLHTCWYCGWWILPRSPIAAFT